jgi:hypothetical protein
VLEEYPQAAKEVSCVAHRKDPLTRRTIRLAFPDNSAFAFSLCRIHVVSCASLFNICKREKNAVMKPK